MSFSKLRNRLSTLGAPKRANSTAAPASTADTPSATATAPAVPPKSPKPAASAKANGSKKSSSNSKVVDGSGVDYDPSVRSLQGVKPNLRSLYPKIEPYETGRLKVDDLHELYWELSGKKDGYPVVFLHGGPGGGVSGDDRRWFDPKHYRILTFDQRGAGKSTPSASLENNTTWDLVADIEKLRELHKVDKWHVFGGSWGSTLSLAYAQTHPDRVTALILRGIFTLRRSELEFFYQNGASHIFPELFAPYREEIPEDERHDMIAAYHKRLTGDSDEARLSAAKKWSYWELGTSKLYVDGEALKRGDDDAFALAFARIECHYFQNRGWIEDGQLLKKENVDKIRHIPTAIVQGRFDVVCPCKTAFDLHAVFPEAKFHLVPDAGHSAKEPGILHHLVNYTDKFRSVGASS
ncbi:putative proline iminopeptidase [Ceraceosorus guamensis]|uniref:Proline iminopeptidase n=1 Tax=Ceraceosorus guamensis TaxID=1522189 RepID=A0A316W291_9BASI|nr:putative proline iminopeptidase [Ceraceosorus guamensis]PWN43208.1 putative proline iminopeptidase [Ceraceosorus guamensis]